ncbi:hypothetical protein EV421DRAFT_492729 [Armillaria borealis]|uniref:Uncharacterized protein n=1 Tax=Armillaria borealis TaxID=47425 RepID=A0AA39JKY2_9AGAR|nr:hypothetical protein EV421DRAFT_492729 [Armillaria borealis]
MTRISSSVPTTMSSRQSHELKRLHGALEAFVAAALDVQTPVAESSAGVLSLGFETTKMPALCCCLLHVSFPYLTGDIDETEGARMYTVNRNTKEIDADHGKRSIWGCRDMDWGWTTSFASMPVGYSRVQTQMSSRNSTGNFACAQVGGRNEGTGGRTAILDGRNNINVHLYHQTTTNSYRSIPNATSLQHTFPSRRASFSSNRISGSESQFSPGHPKSLALL